MRTHRPGADRRDPGFIQMELMLLIVLVGIGAALGLPPLVKLLKHQPMSGGNWGALILGALLAIGGFAPFILNAIDNASESAKKR
jgi:hypothetical protein